MSYCRKLAAHCAMMDCPAPRPSDGKASAASSASTARLARRSVRVKPGSCGCEQFNFSLVFTSSPKNALLTRLYGAAPSKASRLCDSK